MNCVNFARPNFNLNNISVWNETANGVIDIRLKVQKLKITCVEFRTLHVTLS